MSGFPQQHNNNNDDQAEWTQFSDLVTSPWQNLDDLWAPNIATQLPPMLSAEATPHHQTLPQLPSHVPIEASLHNSRGSMVQQNGGSSVPSKAGRGLAWTEEEHRAFLHGLQKHGKGNWKIISKYIPTKSSTQVASHAQKYYHRQNAPLEKKKRKSIHDITLNTVSHHNDPQHSTPHPDSQIQQVHDIHQTQEMLSRNPWSSMTRQMSEFEYFANQQVYKMQQMQERLPVYPQNRMTHQMSEIEYSNNDFGKGCYKPEYPPNNTCSSNN